MKIPFCPHEEKIAELLNTHRWPQNADPALVAHAENCNRCREVVDSVQMLQQLRASTMRQAHPGSASTLWWRAQLRRRNGAVEQMARPVVWAERLAFIGMLGIAVGIAFQQWWPIRHWFHSLTIVAENQVVYSAINWFLATNENNLTSHVMLAGLAAIVCFGGLTLFLSDRSQ